KLKLISEYLNGDLSYDLLARKYHIPSSTPIKRWVHSYKRQGIQGVKRRSERKEYPVQFKVDTVRFILTTGASYLTAAMQFGMNNPSLLAHWMKRYQEQGIEGLKPSPKRRPSMSKKPTTPKKNKQAKGTREKELERENELLRLENAYLKKLRAFRENSNAFHEKHRQSWHSSSNKKDSH
ncbi:helix-turn-helix domain-containing protein, partial [Jeotgalibacillus sp. ET6]|uniref:helix-turn-helix domain-containing protein n=1 Tax=Jeotgalibacillus sp. ET6 TaxID=3037260 RepID=UPI0024181CE1